MNTSSLRSSRSFVVLIALTVAVFCVVGCAPEAPEPPAAAPAAPDPAPAPEAPEPSASADEAPLVVFLGDSLTAGFGLDEDQAYPALIAQSLEAAGTPIRVVNAGVSGDTTAGGLSRLDWLLRQTPDIVVVALGGNDGLRGLPPEEAEKNLRAIIVRCREAGAEVLLAGMLAPPNLGADYTDAFSALYPRLAEEEGVKLVPFLLEGVAAVPELNLADGIHPNVEGQKILARNVEPLLGELLLAK